VLRPPAVKTHPFLSSLLAVSLAFPQAAFAQVAVAPTAPPLPPPNPPATPPPPPPVEPVPYAPAQPVPYAENPPLPPPPVTVEVPRLAGPGLDVVYLKGGGLLRGTLTEAIPNDHATLQMANGQIAVIPWDRVERIDHGGSHPVAPPMAPPVAAPPEAVHGTATVHIESDGPVTLERRVPGTRNWVGVCTAPCDVDVPLYGPYRIVGPGVRNSNDFTLRGSDGDHILLDVSTASKGAFAGGIVMTSLGGFSLLLGATILMTVASSEASNSALGLPNSSDDGSWNTAGWVMVLGGAAAALVGILVLTGNRHTKVGEAAGAPRAQPRNDAWLRAPQPRWNDDRHDDKGPIGMPKVVGAPIFKFSF
jgi:hypothetical protein